MATLRAGPFLPEGSVRALAWRVPANVARRIGLCVRATDLEGKRSEQAYAPLVLR